MLLFLLFTYSNQRLREQIIITTALILFREKKMLILTFPPEDKRAYVRRSEWLFQRSNKCDPLFELNSGVGILKAPINSVISLIVSLIVFLIVGIANMCKWQLKMCTWIRREGARTVFRRWRYSLIELVAIKKLNIDLVEKILMYLYVFLQFVPLSSEVGLFKFVDGYISWESGFYPDNPEFSNQYGSLL